MKILVLLTIILSAFSFAHADTPVGQDPHWKDQYPAIWWQEVPKDQAKYWEVLPQDAGYKEVILSKRNELGIFSNFSEAPFVFHGHCYPTVEAFWQMMKYPETKDDVRWSWASPWKWTRDQVAQMNGFSAKAAGNYANDFISKNNANWVTFEGKQIVFVSQTPGDHYQLIWEALTEKIRQNPEVLRLLLKTNDLKLTPDHHESADSPREWFFNLLWMDIRTALQKGTFSLQTTEDLSLRTCHAKDIKDFPQ